MARDLFADTFTPRPQPKRSRWTIGGSLFAHAAAIGVLLVVPILSVTDSLVLEAKKVIFMAPPPPVVPPEPPPPMTRPLQAAISEMNREAAPTSAPEHPVTGDTPPAAQLGPVTPGAITVSSNTGPSLFTASGTTTIATPPPIPVQSGPIRPGGDIKPPARITYVPPVYPTIAQTAKIEGPVILEAIIDEAGVVRDVKVLRSIPLLDRAAIEAVSKWRYTPTRLNGVPVAIIMTVTVMFSLR